MHSTRRTFLAGSAAAMLAGVRPATAQPQGRIEFLGWSGEEAPSRPSIDLMMQTFEAANPGSKIEWVGFQWADVQRNLLLRLQSNQIPDIVQIQDRWLPSLARLPQMADLNEVFGRERLESVSDPGILAMGRIGTRQMGMPWASGTVGMVYNRKVFDAANIATPPATIEAFLEALRAVKRAKPQSVPYAMATKNNASIALDAQIWFWTFGAKFFDDNARVTINTPEAVRAMEFIIQLMREGLAAPDIDRPDSRRLFAQEQCVMYFDAPVARSFARQMSGQGNSYDPFVVPMPTPVVRAGDQPRAIQWGHVVSLFKRDNRAPAADSVAARFLMHITTNPDIQIQYYRNVGLFPGARASLARSEIASDAYATSWMREATRADRIEFANWPNAIDLNNVISEEVQAGMLGQKTAQTVVQAMAQRLEPLMVRNR